MTEIHDVHKKVNLVIWFTCYQKMVLKFDHF